MRILVAEDDSALASFVKKGLESEHYAVDVSADGEQARAMAGELDFDLVVLDLNLPRLDGVYRVGIVHFYFHLRLGTNVERRLDWRRVACALRSQRKK